MNKPKPAKDKTPEEVLKDFRKKHAKTTKSKEMPKPISAEEEERNILKKVVCPGRHKTQKDITEFWIQEKAKAKQGVHELASRRRNRGGVVLHTEGEHHA